MKKIVVLLVSVMFVGLISCEKKDESLFVVEGIVELPEPSYIYIEEVLSESAQVIDSVKPNGKSFTFKVKPTEKAFYRLNIFGKQQAFIVGGPGEVLKVEVGGNAKDAKFKMSGTKDGDLLYKAFLIAEALRKSEKELSAKYREAQGNGNPQLAQEIVGDFDEILEAKLAECKTLIKEADNSIVALSIASNFFNTNEHFEFLDSLATKFEKELPDSRYAKQFIGMVNDAKALGVGSKAPDFQLATLDGKWLKLSEVKGKAVVIDFWASWCRPCRQENPFMVGLYQKYKGKGLEILGVSLDEDKDDWQKAVIKDKITWKQVSDLNGWNSEVAKLYKVESIPNTYLLDGNGNIVAKNLRGNELEVKIAELLQ